VAVAADQVPDEHADAGHDDEHADRRDEVVHLPSQAGVIGVDPPWHPHQPDYVHGEERHVHANEQQPEVPSPEALVEHLSGELRPPVVDPGEDGERDTADEHIVEVAHNEVGVVRLHVERHGGDHHACDPTDDEGDEKADDEQERRLPHRPARPDRRAPRHDLHARRDGDRHARRGEEAQHQRRQPHSEHVVCPQPERQEADCDHCADQPRIADDPAVREGRQDHRHHARRWEELDVDLRVAEDPEQVLPQQRAASLLRVEELGAEAAIELEQQAADDQRGEREQDHERRH
jgi:hypothetical protein